MGFLREKGLISGFLESNILKFHKVRIYGVIYQTNAVKYGTGTVKYGTGIF